MVSVAGLPGTGDGGERARARGSEVELTVRRQGCGPWPRSGERPRHVTRRNSKKKVRVLLGKKKENGHLPNRNVVTGFHYRATLHRQRIWKISNLQQPPSHT